MGGMRDTEDQLDACKAQSVEDERTIENLLTRLDEQRRMTDETQERLRHRALVITERDRQIAELEHDLARAETALADRLQHDAHARPQALRIDRAAVLEVIDTWAKGGQFDGEFADEIIALVQPLDAVLLTPEEAALAVRACRHSAESIRSFQAVDPTRLHPDVARYVERLTDLADRLVRDAG